MCISKVLYDEKLKKILNHDKINKEIYAPIYHDLIKTNYWISNYGHIYNTKNNRYLSCNFSSANPYDVFQIRVNKKACSKRLHRVLAECFILNPNNYSEVDHIDNNPRNNVLENLRWVTAKYNCQNRSVIRGHSVGHKGISKKKDSFVVRIVDNDGHRHYKTLHSLDEAIEYHKELSEKYHGPYSIYKNVEVS